MVVSLAVDAAALFACPFCTAVQPSFAERRAEGAAVVVGEVQEAGDKMTFAVHQVWKGREALGGTERIVCESEPPLRRGATAVLLGNRSGDEWSWEVVPADETSLAYFARLPDVGRPWTDRVRYCAKFLEHDDPTIADDAFREFGRAPFDAVAAAADVFDFTRIRAWLVSPKVSGERKGLYGLLLGLARDDAARSENVALLRKLVEADANDFRAGFDGILGGLLWADGVAALDTIDERIMRNRAAAEGDVRHAQTALRFYQQYGSAIPAERLKRSIALLLDRPATAAGAVQDLTRRQDWEFVARSAELFTTSPGDDPTLDRAVIGYLLVCPRPEGAAALRKLRQTSPRRVEEAERYLALIGVRGSS